MYGRETYKQYPTYYMVNNTYDKYGNLTEVKDGNNRPIWKAVAENARGQITQERKGNHDIYYAFDDRGLSTYFGGNVVSMVYDFDNKGNLQYRGDDLGNEESFLYDTKDRLISWNASTEWGNYSKNNSIAYNSTTGNIDSKTDIGTFKYGVINNEAGAVNHNPGPHALTSVDGNLTALQPQALNVTYTDFKKIKTLSEGNKYYELTYGVDDQRRKSEYKINGQTQLTRYYLGDYEEEVDALGNVKQIHYLSGAIMIMTNYDYDSQQLYYSYTDYQGSLIALTDENGTVVERYAYDPWGARRNPENWTESDSRTSWIVNRGYTGHEHLDAFGIINMNGRVYDPLTAMFFSPDPYVQAPGNWLNYNRYGYCFGNPMKYTDPSGEFIQFVILAAVIGFSAYQGGRIANGGEANPSNWDWNSPGTYLGTIAGGLVGWASFGAGSAVMQGGGFMANTMGIMAASHVNSIGMMSIGAVAGVDVPYTLGFGVGSVTMGSQGVELGYLGKKGNKWYENLGYGFGALANVSDILAGFKPGEVQLQTENTTSTEAVDKVGHSQLLEPDGKSLIDFGPGEGGDFYKFNPGRNNWTTYATNGAISQTKNIRGNIFTEGISIKGVNATRIKAISNNLNKNPRFYNFLTRSCSSVAARALTASGAPMFGIHPYLLQMQASLWNIGIRPWSYSYLINQQN